MRVLIAADESDHGAEVARVARGLFGDDATYLFLTVAALTPPVGWTAGWGVATPMAASGALNGAVVGSLTTTEADLMARRAERHASAVSELATMEFAEPIGDVGDPAGCILASARAHEADVIVVGFHDRSWFSRLLAPSVSREVVREAEVPVLVVKWPGRFESNEMEAASRAIHGRLSGRERRDLEELDVRCPCGRTSGRSRRRWTSGR